MNLIPKSFFDLDKFFDDFRSPLLPAGDSSPFFTPRVDIKEKDDQYVITAELPGVKKDDIHVNLENGVLTLEAETTHEDKEEKGGKVIRQERRYGKFVRSFNIGVEIKERDISASFEDGVLELKAPKVRATTPTQKSIPIN